MQHLYLMLWCRLAELQNHSGWRNLRRFVVQLSAQSKDLKWTQTRLPRILSLGNLQKLNLCNLCERLFLRLDHSQWELPFLLSEDLSCVSVCFILFYHASLISPALSSQWSLCQAAMSLPKLPPWGWTSSALSASHWPSAPVPSHLSGPLLNLFHVISLSVLKAPRLDTRSIWWIVPHYSAFVYCCWPPDRVYLCRVLSSEPDCPTVIIVLLFETNLDLEFLQVYHLHT